MTVQCLSRHNNQDQNTEAMVWNHLTYLGGPSNKAQADRGMAVIREQLDTSNFDFSGEVAYQDDIASTWDTSLWAVGIGSGDREPVPERDMSEPTVHHQSSSSHSFSSSGLSTNLRSYVDKVPDNINPANLADDLNITSQQTTKVGCYKRKYYDPELKLLNQNSQWIGASQDCCISDSSTGEESTTSYSISGRASDRTISGELLSKQGLEPTCQLAGFDYQFLFEQARRIPDCNSWIYENFTEPSTDECQREEAQHILSTWLLDAGSPWVTMAANPGESAEAGGPIGGAMGSAMGCAMRHGRERSTIMSLAKWEN
ncbi:hypothetical protein B0H10DRAFT_1950306 [Mycena sp. CBHHK59/15]|nr:hypothetical protein B0H10DRAFT_1950306 [Mycena sp. CBHHK59/15]